MVCSLIHRSYGNESSQRRRPPERRGNQPFATWNPHSERWVKRDGDTGRFMDMKPNPKPFKGVRKEN